MKKFTEIKDLSDQVRLTRLGKIRLGAKLISGNNKEYPIQLPFFLLPDDVALIHGGKIEKPVERAAFLGVKQKKVLDFIEANSHRLAEELPVMIPVEDRNISFPQAWKLYGSSAGLKCIGNGEEASERQGITNNWNDKVCPCNKMRTDENPKGECTRSGNLQIILPEVNMGGVYQIDIGSINSIIDINSAFKVVPAMVGRIAMVPLKLRRVPTETHHDGKKQIHWTCQLMIVGSIKQIASMRASDNLISHSQILENEDPQYQNPQLDPPDAIYIQPESIKKMIDELDNFRKKKKLSKELIKRTREAIDDNNDEEIQTIHAQALKEIPSGTTASQVSDKLKSKDKEPDKSSIEEPPLPEEENTTTNQIPANAERF